MQAVFVQEGASIDYTPAADVAAGDVVVQGELVGVAKQPIPANTHGALAVEGVFDFAKGTGALSVGVIVYWDDTNNVVTTTSSGNKQVCKVIRAAAASDTTVRVRMSQ